MYRKNFFLGLSGVLALLYLIGCTEKEPDNTPPVAKFTVGSNTGTIETLFTFDATSSYDLEDSSDLLKIRWDWESDGRWDTEYSTTKILKKGFNTTGFYKVKLEVRDTKGLTSAYTEIINIEDYFLVDPRDQKQYKTIKIGTQLWMAENLNFNTYEASYCHKNNVDTCRIYGRLYEWDAAFIACPNGWHLPSDDEWKLLTDYVGDKAGYKMKSDHGWIAEQNGSNSTGFNTLPASYLTEYGEFMALGAYAFFWSSTENQGDKAWSRMLSYNQEIIERNFYNKKNAFSVRCLKN